MVHPESFIHEDAFGMGESALLCVTEPGIPLGTVTVPCGKMEIGVRLPTSILQPWIEVIDLHAGRSTRHLLVLHGVGTSSFEIPI